MAFPRTKLPEAASALWTPGALKTRGHSAIVQVRATNAIGWSWEEAWGLLSVKNPDHMELLAYVARAWNRGTIFDATHPLTPGSGLPPNGLGTGSVLVDGAGQTGSAILTDGWPLNTSNCVRAGDVIKFAGDNAVYMVAEHGSSNGVGEVTIQLTSPKRVAAADNAAVTTTGVLFRVTLLSRSRFEASRAPTYYSGLSVVFTEAL